MSFSGDNFYNRKYFFVFLKKGSFHTNDMFTQCLSKDMFLTLYYSAFILISPRFKSLISPLLVCIRLVFVKNYISLLFGIFKCGKCAVFSWCGMFEKTSHISFIWRVFVEALSG